MDRSQCLGRVLVHRSCAGRYRGRGYVAADAETDGVGEDGDLLRGKVEEESERPDPFLE